MADAASTRLAGPLLPDDQPRPRCVRCDASAAVAALGWLVCLGGTLASVVYFILLTLHIQLHDSMGAAFEIATEMGVALGVAWLIFEPLAIEAKVVCTARARKRRAARVGDDSLAPAPLEAASPPPVKLPAMTVLSDRAAARADVKGGARV